MINEYKLAFISSLLSGTLSIKTEEYLGTGFPTSRGGFTSTR